MTPEEIETPRPWPTSQCEEDRCRSTDLRISITSWQRRAGEVRGYEHLYCAPHGRLAAVWRNVPIQGAPRVGGC